MKSIKILYKYKWYRKLCEGTWILWNVKFSATPVWIKEEEEIKGKLICLRVEIY